MEENNIQELEEMRQQLNILQEKLDQQDIVNEKLLKSSMKSKMSWIVKYIIGEVIAIPILAIMLSGIYVMFNLPFYSYIYILLICVADIYMDYKINISSMKPADYEKNNLMQTVKKLIKMKKMRSYQTLFGFLLTCIWLFWLGYDMCHLTGVPNTELYNGLVHGCTIGMGIGGVIGLVIAYFIYKKMQSTNDEIIKIIEAIDDLKDNKEN